MILIDITQKKSSLVDHRVLFINLRNAKAATVACLRESNFALRDCEFTLGDCEFTLGDCEFSLGYCEFVLGKSRDYFSLVDQRVLFTNLRNANNGYSSDFTISWGKQRRLALGKVTLPCAIVSLPWPIVSLPWPIVSFPWAIVSLSWANCIDTN